MSILPISHDFFRHIPDISQKHLRIALFSWSYLFDFLQIFLNTGNLTAHADSWLLSSPPLSPWTVELFMNRINLLKMHLENVKPIFGLFSLYSFDWNFQCWISMKFDHFNILQSFVTNIVSCIYNLEKVWIFPVW